MSEFRLPLRQVVQVMKPAFERTFHCNIDLYDPKSKTIAMLRFNTDYPEEVVFTLHIYERDDEDTPRFDFMPRDFEVNSDNLRVAALCLPRAFELLAILELV